MKVAVVGGGIMGSSSALALADFGHHVTLFEQFAPGHRRGSSHGRSRIVRRAYPDAFYTQIMQEGYPLWAKLDSRLGGKILNECGLLYFGRGDSPSLTQMTDGLGRLGVDHAVLDPRGVEAVLPELRLSSNEVGVHTPEAGWVDADAAVGGTLNLAETLGAKVVQERIADPRSLLTRFDRVIVCAGPWTGMWFDVGARVTLQTFAYVPCPKPQGGPVWIEDGPDLLYGFPSEPGAGTFKVGVHSPGPEIDPDVAERNPVPEKLEIVKEFALRRFGVDAAPVEPTACLYTSTPTEDFRLGWEGERLFWVSACSGHGFKFGPWIGNLMAGFAEGRRHPSEFPRLAVF